MVSSCLIAQTCYSTHFPLMILNGHLFLIILTSGLHHPMEKSRTSCVSELLLLLRVLLLLLLLFCAALIAPHSNKAEQHRLRASPVRAEAGGCTDGSDSWRLSRYVCASRFVSHQRASRRPSGRLTEGWCPGCEKHQRTAAGDFDAPKTSSPAPLPDPQLTSKLVFIRQFQDFNLKHVDMW